MGKAINACTVPEAQDRQPVQAGTLASMLAQACAQCGTQPSALLDYSIKPGAVVLILPDGRKVTFAISAQPDPAAASPQDDSSEIPLADAVELMHELAGRKPRRRR